MKKITTLLLAVVASGMAAAQVPRTDNPPVRTRDTSKVSNNRQVSNNNVTARDNAPTTEVERNQAVLSRDFSISSEDSAGVFIITDGNLNVRSYEGRVPVKQVGLILATIKMKPSKLILSSQQPKLGNASLRFGSADINFETGKVAFVYRLDPRYIIKETSNQTVSPYGEISSYTKSEVIKLDQRSYEFFNGFVGAKVKFQKNQKYLVQFWVESTKLIDYTVWIGKEYKEVLVSSSGFASLPKPNQRYFYSGIKKITIIVEPGAYEGDYYIMLAGNFQNGSWIFDRFEMTPMD